MLESKLELAEITAAPIPIIGAVTYDVSVEPIDDIVEPTDLNTPPTAPSVFPSVVNFEAADPVELPALFIPADKPDVILVVSLDFAVIDDIASPALLSFIVSELAAVSTDVSLDFTSSAPFILRDPSSSNISTASSLHSS
jgi:hypothetical protein